MNSKVIGSLLAVLLLSCQSPVSQSTTGTGTNNQTPVTPASPTFGTLKAIMYDGATAKLWDGTNLVDWKTGTVRKASGGNYLSVGSSVYQLASNGGATETALLPKTPTALLVTGSSNGRAVVSGGEVWSFAVVTKDEMFAVGYGSGTWSHVYKGSTEVFPWYIGTVASAFVAGNGDVIAVGAEGRAQLADVSRSIPGTVMSAAENGIIVTESSTNLYVIDTDGTQYTYDISAQGLNPVSPCQWWEEGGVWYSTRGHKWSPTLGWRSGATALKDFAAAEPPSFTGINRLVLPFVIRAGSIGSITYVIETVSGWLIKFDASTNVYQPVVQLFAGDSLDNGAGYQRAFTMLPQISGSTMYWHYNGTLWQTDLSTTITTAFSADQQFWLAE